MFRGGQAYDYALRRPMHVAGLTRSDPVGVNQYEYTPWGERLASTEGVENPLQYAARHYGSHEGMHPMRARWYDPQLGRWISEDPIGLAGGSTSPINRRHPSGSRAVECWIELEHTGWTRGLDVVRAAKGCAAPEGGGVARRSSLVKRHVHWYVRSRCAWAIRPLHCGAVASQCSGRRTNHRVARSVACPRLKSDEREICFAGCVRAAVRLYEGAVGSRRTKQGVVCRRCSDFRDRSSAERGHPLHRSWASSRPDCGER